MNKTKGKKILSLVLTFCMVLSLLPSMAFAAEINTTGITSLTVCGQSVANVEGNGEKTSPYTATVYVENYDDQKVLVRQNNEYLQIDFQDIIAFYSDKKDIYCRTKSGEYKIKNSLSRLENQANDFVRISKSCIINIKHLDSFDMGETGSIVVKLDDGTEEIVSRRKVKEILRYIKERSI